MTSVARKLGKLKKTLLGLDSVIVAFSGGVDSTFLLKMCLDVLGERVLAVTADSAICPSHELAGAIETANSLGARHLMIETKEMEIPEFAANPSDRCYYCKKELFGKLKEIAAMHGISNIVDGANHDDLEDHRPGMRAAAEFEVRHPLQEAGLTKSEIRSVSKKMGLSTWNKPSMACLASRIPYNTPITKEALISIDAAEAFIRSLGIEQVRVRHYGQTARIEVEPQCMKALADDANRQLVVSHLKELGYLHVTLDLAGYRTGSMNEGIPT